MLVSKRKIVLTFVVALVLTAAVSCATSTFVSGKDFDHRRVSSIVKDSTTRTDVEKLFGQPFSKYKASEVEIWTYQFVKSTGRATSVIVYSSASAEVFQKTLTITFDSTETVRSFTYSESGDPKIR